jgi:amino acid adenylation domain-containing protein
MLVGILGIWKAGGAYVPLDPSFPSERLSYMLHDSGAKVLVTEAVLARELVRGSEVACVCLDADRAAIERQSRDSVPLDADPSRRAYVIYTSGSTGRPKGVEIEHRALMNFLCAMQEAPGIARDDILVAVTTMSFDIAALELLLPLTVGARVELVGRDAAVDPAALSSILVETGATVMQATPATWRMLIESGWRGSPTLKVLCGGEALGKDLAEQLLPLCGELWNMYGPTETTVWSSVERVEPARDVTIGRPIANTRMYVLDRHLAPVPRGVVGELWIAGDGVARGYHDRPELTAERFLADPFNEGRMYRTGDLARHTADGRMQWVGREDQQIKIRGHRIELDEIESVLTEHPHVAECAVIATGSEETLQLAAYVVGQGDSVAYREHLRARLPEYMVPAHYVPMAALPRTPNNKIDRNALPALIAQASSEAAYSPPRGRLERDLAAIWADVLRRDRVSANESFFDIGGNSLLIVKVQQRIKNTLHHDIPIIAFFRRPTIRALAEFVDSGGAENVGREQLRERIKRQSEVLQGYTNPFRGGA